MEFADILPYLCAILALLLVWQYHEKQVLAGRIQAVDIFDRSGVRMYVYATSAENETCDSCREVNGMVFLPSRVANKGFTPVRKPCSNKGHCTVVMVGLYGAWREARQVVQQLRAAREEGVIHISNQQLIGLIEGKWEASVSAATDRLSVLMLTALNAETTDPNSAREAYERVIEEAKEVRDLPLVVPAYLRLTELLSRQGYKAEALQIIAQFEKRFPPSKNGPYYPKGTQRGLMTIKKSHLRTAPHSPPTAPEDKPEEHKPAEQQSETQTEATPLSWDSAS